MKEMFKIKLLPITDHGNVLFESIEGRISLFQTGWINGALSTEAVFNEAKTYVDSMLKGSGTSCEYDVVNVNQVTDPLHSDPFKDLFKIVYVKCKLDRDCTIAVPKSYSSECSNVSTDLTHEEWDFVKRVTTLKRSGRSVEDAKRLIFGQDV